MSGLAQAFDGRESISFIAEKKSPAVIKQGKATNPDSLSAGDMGFIKSKSTGTSTAATVFGNFPVGSFFVAPCTIELAYNATGDYDSIELYDTYFLGFANDKSMSMSKNTTESTMDYNKMAVQSTDGLVSISGSVAGYNIVESLADASHKSGINLLKKNFTPMGEISKTGTTTWVESDTASKHNLFVLWNIRNAKADEFVTANLIPALFTGLSTQASNGSVQSFSVDYSGNDVDSDGNKATSLQIQLTADLKTAIVNAMAMPSAS